MTGLRWKRYCKAQDKATKHKVVKEYYAQRVVFVKVVKCTECGEEHEEW